MLTIISCRDAAFSRDRFGLHAIPGDDELFAGGPLGQPIIIHGYNCTEERLVQEYVPFAGALGRDCIAYSWPGGGHPLDFPAAVGRASLAGYRLRDVFSMRHLRQGRDSVVAHSLGARLVLTALRDGLLQIEKLILMGPAVDWDVFESDGDFAKVPGRCESIHILYSNRDEVLKLAFPLGDFGGDCRALGFDGPRDPALVPKNIVLHDVSAFVGEHTAYLTNPECAELVRQILSD